MFVRNVDEALRTRQRSLVIVFDDHDIGVADVRAKSALETRLDIYRDRLLEIHPQHLLATADHAHFQNRRPVDHVDEFAAHVRGTELLLERRCRIVVADDADQRHVDPQRREVQRHVRGAAGSVFARLDVDDRHRRLLRHATGSAVPVPIEHDVPDDEDGSVAK